MWLNYLCSESQQLQLVITGREMEEKWQTLKSEEEEGGKTGERKKRGGGAVESKRKRERWRESMFPTRSIQLSIILLQSDDSSSWRDEDGRKRQCRKRQKEREGGDGVGKQPPVSAAYLQCGGEICVAMQIHCLVCLAGLQRMKTQDSGEWEKKKKTGSKRKTWHHGNKTQDKKNKLIWENPRGGIGRESNEGTNKDHREGKYNGFKWEGKQWGKNTMRCKRKMKRLV